MGDVECKACAAGLPIVWDVQRRRNMRLARMVRQTAIGSLDDTRIHMLHEIHTASSDLVLPDWFPLQEERHDTTAPSPTTTKH